MVDQLSWRIVSAKSAEDVQTRLPGSMLTVGPAFEHESMPAEVAILLPTNPGPNRLIEHVTATENGFEDVMLGLFLASPFLNTRTEGPRLARAGITWITNLPSVVQQDEEFSQQLSDVGLGFDRELEYLAQFRDEGFSVAVVVADDREARAAAGIEPDAMIVIPRVADFAAGFPSLRQRGTAVQSVAQAVKQAKWKGPLIGFGEAREAENQALWPSRLDGLVCRPAAIADRRGQAARTGRVR